MEDDLYREIENMVARMLSQALQPLTREISEMKAGQTLLIERSQSLNKKAVWELVKWCLGIIAAFGTVIAGMWIGHLEGWIH